MRRSSRHSRESGNPAYLKTAVKRWQSFDTPAMRATQDERPFTKLETTPFVLSALRSKVYRSMSGVATAVFRLN